MKRSLLFLVTLILVFIPLTTNVANAHPGKTDANGGHTCWTNCAKWGLKAGQYHYHNPDGSATFTKPTTKPKPAPKPVPKPTPLTVYIDGVKQTYDVPPVLENGRTLVPLRGIFESLGASVEWNQKQQLVRASHSGTKIQLRIGSKSPTVNGKIVPIDVPAKMTSGRTIVPLRFVGEALGATVQYDSANRAVKITSVKKK